jgi:hypothetical protein
MGQVFNFRNGYVHAVNFFCYGAKLPNFKLKTWPKQLLRYLPIDIVLRVFGLQTFDRHKQFLEESVL